MSPFYNAETAGERHLLVYLHGHGASPQLLHPYFRQHHDDGWVRVCPQAPIPLDDGASWFESGPRGVDAASLAEAVRRVRDVTAAALAELDADWSQVVLGGFSQGAATALAVAATARDDQRPGGLLLQAGFVPEVFDDEIDLTAVTVPAVLIQHGADDEVVPAYAANDLAAALGADGRGGVDVEILPGGHTLSAAMLDGARRFLGHAPS